jgi:hypothetical protein
MDTTSAAVGKQKDAHASYEFAPPVERVAAAVGPLGLVADCVRQCGFGDFALEVGPVACPVTERAPEPVRSEHAALRFTPVSSFSWKAKIAGAMSRGRQASRESYDADSH